MMSRKRFEKIRHDGFCREYEKGEYWFWEYIYLAFGEPRA
jgi:hypothetical protein